MDRAERFLAGLERISSSPVGNGSQRGLYPVELPDPSRRALSGPFRTPLHRNPLSIPQRRPTSVLGVDTDMALDAFDRELLDEIPQALKHEVSQQSSRVSLPPRQPDVSRSIDICALRDGSQCGPTLVTPSSSSSDPISSPTLSMLQNRRCGFSGPAGHDSNSLHHDSNNRSQGSSSTHAAQPQRRMAIASRSQNQAPPIIRGIQLVSTSTLSDQLRSLFQFELFNAVQSKCFQSAFKTNDNLVLAAPTGSGKTAVMELAICRLIATCKGQDFKIIYQAPTKSLCSERYRDWQAKFGVLDLQCAELTGDTDYGHLGDVQKASIIITTPEKWDSVTRKWKDHMKLMQLIKLFLVDEVHILKEARGATLEAVVSRMKSIGPHVRFVALSATVPNSEDIATWLGKDGSHPTLPAQREVFDETFRPVKLEKHVYGIGGAVNDWTLDRLLMKHVPKSISQHGKGKPTMIFCMTRRSVIQTANLLVEMWKTSPSSNKPWTLPRSPVIVTDTELRKTVSTAVAFHHGGLSPADRQAIEKGFLDGTIKVVCSTSTLAVGVNLPCYLVILQGTLCYGDKGLQEYSDLEVMQMLGRAGRPQFESSACAVILTRQEKVSRYRRMVSGQELLESCLHHNLIEHLNAEVCLGTIFDLESAKRWLNSSFLCVRLRQNPDHYRFREGVSPHNEHELIQQLCEKDLSLLKESSLIEGDGSLKSSQFGDAMARYCVKFESMKILLTLPPKAKVSEMLSTLSQATEFHDVRMKAAEKSFYKEINRSNEIRFPVKVDVAQQMHKVSLIIQAELGCVALPAEKSHSKHHQQYNVDKSVVFSHANRLIRCIIDCQLHLEDGVSARNALELGRSIGARVWDCTAAQMRQLPGIGEVSVRKLAAAGINSIDSLLNCEPTRIEHVMGKTQPFGNELLRKLSVFPSLRVSVKEVGREIKSGKAVTIKLSVEIGFMNNPPPFVYNKTPVSVCFLAETSSGHLIDFRRFAAKKLQNGAGLLLAAQLTKPTGHIRCYVMCDAIAGTCRYAELLLGDIPSWAYAAPDAHPTPDIVNETTQPIPDRKSQNGDEFDDDGVADADLLAIGVGLKEFETVQDVDDILAEEPPAQLSKEPNRHRATKLSATVEAEDTELGDYREPTRLQNGRWSCQHPCRDRGLQCKHSCCRDGVLKPKRRPKHLHPSEVRQPKQAKITDMTQATKKVTVAGKRQEPDLGKLLSSASREEHSSSNRRTHRGSDATGQQSKREDVPDIETSRRDGRRSFGANLLPGSATGSQSRLPSKSEWIDVKSNVELAGAGPISDEGAQDDDEDQFEELFGANDCDWVVPDLDNSFLSEVVVDDAQNSEHVGASIGAGLDFNDDFCNLGPPLPYVNMADVHMRNQSVKGAEQLPPTLGMNTKVPDLPFEQAEAEFRKATPLDRSPSLSPEFVQLVVAPGEEHSKTPRDMAVPQKQGIALMVENGVPTPPTVDIKSSHEENEKKKWEGLEGWMYEQFHDIVELI